MLQNYLFTRRPWILLMALSFLTSNLSLALTHTHTHIHIHIHIHTPTPTHTHTLTHHFLVCASWHALVCDAKSMISTLIIFSPISVIYGPHSYTFNPVLTRSPISKSFSHLLSDWKNIQISFVENPAKALTWPTNQPTSLRRWSALKFFNQ